MTKNELIKQTLLETRKRRKNQILKVFELKVNIHSTSKQDLEKFNWWFTQAKWVQNDIIASDDIFNYEYQDHRVIWNKNKDNELVERKLDINTGIHQNLVKGVRQDIINLSKAKEKGLKVGRLKFRKTCNCISLKTGMTHLVNSKTLSIPGFRNLKVYGLEQFINIPNFELADAKIIRKASGIYIKISVMLPKSNFNRIDTNKTVGLDFGIKDNIITSDGEKFNCSVRETEHLKFLQRKLHKKQKGSKRYYKLLNQTNREYEHLSNKKDDDANKLVSHLLREYDVIYFQDEQISEWRKDNQYYAQNIQHSYMGRVKAKLVELQKSGRSFEISKWTPTTKSCPNCGALNEGITLNDRVFKCSCGYEFDRDIHAARNVKKFGSTKRAECLEQASAEPHTSTGSGFQSGTASVGVEAKTKASSL